MNILLYDWDSQSQKDIIDTFKSLGYSIINISDPMDNYDSDERFIQVLEEYIKKLKCDFCFSFNYFPNISIACNRKNIKYISWVYDSPHMTLYSKTIFNECNYIFIFDKMQYEEMKAYGVERVYHMPLAVNIKKLDKMLSCPNKKYKKISDISFVGSLYDENFFEQIEFLPQYLKGYLDGISNAQKLIYGYYFIEELLTSDIIGEIKKYVKFDLGDNYFVPDNTIFSELFLGKYITSMERQSALELLSKTFKLDLYTGSKKRIAGLTPKGVVDYDTEMPYVFQSSKINLNITLRTIKSGIPLRAWDILGSQGFLISNYQIEFLDYFKPDEDLVFYESINDLIDKVSFYLKHDEIRKQISKNGYEKVAKYHTYESRIKEIFSIVKKD